MFDGVTFAPTHSEVCETKDELMERIGWDKFNFHTSDVTSSRNFRMDSNGEFSVDNEKKLMTTDALRNYCKLLKIPDPFARLIPLELLADNINTLSNELERSIKYVYRNSDGAIVNVIKDTFTPVAYEDILSKIYFEFLGTNEARIPAVLSTDGLVLSTSVPIDSDIEVDKGDIISIGKELFMSESGFGDVKAKVKALRLVCSNGATMTNVWGVIRRNANPKMKMSTAINSFIEDYNDMLPSVDRLVEGYNIMKNEEMFDEDFVNICNNVQRIIGSPKFGDFEGDDVEETPIKRIGYALLNVDDKIDELNKRVSKRSREAKKHPFDPYPEMERVSGVTYYDMYNRITAMPHSYRKDLKRTLKTEELGGRLIQYVLETFSLN